MGGVISTHYAALFRSTRSEVIQNYVISHALLSRLNYAYTVVLQINREKNLKMVLHTTAV